MARLPRIDLPGLPQHVWTRGNNRSDLFRDEADRYVTLRLLQESAAQHGCGLHAFVLMSNHIHLLATGHEHGAISRLMQSLGRRMCRYINARHSRTGALFEGRFKSSLIDSDSYLLTCMRYIESNPVRACMVRSPRDFPWSSFAQNASGEPGAPLTAHEIYLGLGRDPVSRGEAYVRLFDLGLSEVELKSIRQSLHKNRALGSAAFCRRIQELLHRPVEAAGHGGSRKRPGQGDGLPSDLTP